MADKRRPGLRDEIGASLEGLDDLAAGLSDDDDDVIAADADADPGATLEELDPEYRASLDEVSTLAAELAHDGEPGTPAAEGSAADHAAGGIRHLGIEAEATSVESFAASWVDDDDPPADAERFAFGEPAATGAAPELSEPWAEAVDAADDLYESDIADERDIDLGAAEASANAWDVASDGAFIDPDAAEVDADAPVAEYVGNAPEIQVPQSSHWNDPADTDDGGDDGAPDTDAGTGDAPPADTPPQDDAVAAWSQGESPAAGDTGAAWSERAAAPDNAAADVAPDWNAAELTFQAVDEANPAPTSAASETAEASAPVASAPVQADEAVVSPTRNNSQITASVMPAAGAESETAGARPWTPEAAMEPIPPLAPPPARPMAPLPDIAPPRLPADGGKKMNILPVVMIGVFVILIMVLIVIVVRQT